MHTRGQAGQDSCGLETTLKALCKNLQVPDSKSRPSTIKAEVVPSALPYARISPAKESHPRSHLDEQQHRNSEPRTVQRAVQACQQLRRDVPWSAGHSGNRHQEWPCSCWGRAGTREVPWEGRMLLLQDKDIKLANPPSFHLLVSPSTKSVNELLISFHLYPVLSARPMSSSG